MCKCSCTECKLNSQTWKVNLVQYNKVHTFNVTINTGKHDFAFSLQKNTSQCSWCWASRHLKTSTYGNRTQTTETEYPLNLSYDWVSKLFPFKLLTSSQTSHRMLHAVSFQVITKMVLVNVKGFCSLNITHSTVSL